ncbi:hypothetical protein [Roseibium sp.]|uniref:hypothetical protein n=1 Tax=Roseibium sp. TaxID=1936156 RepID=UPI003A983AB8
MTLRAFSQVGLVAAALLVSGLAQAADFVTSRVKSWDPVSRTLVLTDKTQFQSIPSDIILPDAIQAGQTVTVSYIGSEDGVSKLLSIRIQP